MPLLPCFGRVKLCDILSWVKNKVTLNDAFLPVKLFVEKMHKLFVFLTLIGGND